MRSPSGLSCESVGGSAAASSAEARRIFGMSVEADNTPAVCRKLRRVRLTRSFEEEVGMAEEIYLGAVWFVKRPSERCDAVSHLSARAPALNVGASRNFGKDTLNCDSVNGRAMYRASGNRYELDINQNIIPH